MRNLVLNGIGRLFFASIFSSLMCTTHAQYEGALAPPETLRSGYESIKPEQCREWLEILAGPTFAGRGTGQPGHVKAAHWIAGKVAEFGLEPMGDGETYFQMLEMNRVFVDDELSKISGPDDLEIGFAGAVGLDHFSDKPEVAGPLIFLAMKGDATLSEEMELRDKIVILATDEAGRSGSAVNAVTRQRPLAVLLVTESAPTSTAQVQGTSGRRRSGGSLSGAISLDAATKLVAAAGGDANWLELNAEDPAVVHATDASIKIELRTREQPMAVPNVLAWLEGSDPDLRHEYVVIGAHLDHLGKRNDAVYPGADDNGSGSTAILSIAKAMTVNPVKPKRSVLFIWFAAEEIGLLGSAHYVANPLLPLDNMVCMLNIDMVGRNEEKGNETAAENEQTLHLVGSQKGDLSLHELILEANRHVNFTFEFDEEGVFGRSDQINFFRKGTSVAFLFGGFHPDYHRTSDEPAKINYRKIASAARLFYISAYQATEHGPFPVPVAEPEAQSDN
jgi:hypothetical protein